MQLSKHFKLEEFTKSMTATRKGIDNTPGAGDIKNLEDLTLLKSLFIGNTSLSSLDVSQLPLLEFVEAPNTNLLNCIQVSQNQLDNFVSTWTYDEGQGFSTSCN